MNGFVFFLAMLSLWALLMIAFTVRALAGIFYCYHQDHPGASNPKPQTANFTKEDRSMKLFRFALVAIIAIALILVAGCSTFGNGKADLPFEIEVVYVDSAGIEYHAEAGPDGAAFYVSVNGAVFQPVALNEDGLIITGPDGSKIRIKQVAQVPPPDAPPVSAKEEAASILDHMSALP